ncbi:MAG: class I SAM-dependent methyltransferase [Chromatiales bacterium]
MTKECPICANEDVSLIRDIINDGNKTNVLHCSDCDLDFLETWDDVEYVKSLYDGDKYVFTHNVAADCPVGLKYDEYEKRYQWMKPYLGNQSSLLEIGCGDGKFLRMVRDDVAVAEGLELSPPQVARLRSEGFTCYDVMIDEMEAPRQYDIVCMFAVLEHVPLVRNFLDRLKNYLHPDSHVFIEVPNLNNPLVSGVDIPEFRNFYYRSIHLYYFTPTSLGKLLGQEGFAFNLHTSQQASITNHFHWMHKHQGQANGNYMTSVEPPVTILDKLPMRDVLGKVDDYYRDLLEQNDMGDLLSAHAKLSLPS